MRARLLGLDYLAQPVSRPVVSSACKRSLGGASAQARRSGLSIADFYAPAAKLVVELDGAQHLELGQAKYDAQRTRDLEQQGLKVLRFDDRQALRQTESVLEAIFQAVKNPS